MTPEEIFADDGPLARAIDGYRMRTDQVTLSRAIADATRDAAHLVAEAPTGVGKSFAYLVPAFLRACDPEPKRTLVVTPTKALQDQLVDKDLPLLQRVLEPVLGRSVSYALLKGRTNYVCLDRLRKNSAGIEREKGNTRLADEILSVAEYDLDAIGGEIDRLPFDLSVKARSKVTCSSDDCLFGKCGHYKIDEALDPCFVSLARAEASRSSIIVANYHLLFWDVMLGGLVLPSFDSIVFDEAHALPEVARSFFDDKLTRGSVSKLFGGLGVDPESNALRERLSIVASQFFDGLDRYAAGERSVWIRDGLPERLQWEPLREAIAAISKHHKSRADDDPQNAHAEKRAEKADRLFDRFYDLVTCGDPARAYFVAVEDGEASLRSSLVDVSGFLRTNIFEGWPSVLTSATLSVDGSIAHFATNTGVPNPRFVTVDSPFDWQRQAVFLVDGTAPNPSEEREKFDAHVVESMVEIVKVARGRTLGLFTSKRMRDRVAEVLDREVDFPVLCQGRDGPVRRVVSEFKRDVDSVLVGTHALWQGIDAPGETCSCVVIDKLPFPSPDDPVLSVLRFKLGREFFAREVIPRMIIPIKQGFGRAVRSVDDRCAIVLLDPRPLLKSYGGALFRSLPPAQRVTNRNALSDFFEAAP